MDGRRRPAAHGGPPGQPGAHRVTPAQVVQRAADALRRRAGRLAWVGGHAAIGQRGVAPALGCGRGEQARGRAPGRGAGARLCGMHACAAQAGGGPPRKPSATPGQQQRRGRRRRRRRPPPTDVVVALVHAGVGGALDGQVPRAVVRLEAVQAVAEAAGALRAAGGSGQAAGSKGSSGGGAGGARQAACGSHGPRRAPVHSSQPASSACCSLLIPCCSTAPSGLTRMRVLQSSPLQPAGQRHQPVFASHTPAGGGRKQVHACSAVLRCLVQRRQQRQPRYGGDHSKAAPATAPGQQRPTQPHTCLTHKVAAPEAGLLGGRGRHKRDGLLRVVPPAPVAARGAALRLDHRRVGPGYGREAQPLCPPA